MLDKKNICGQCKYGDFPKDACPKDYPFYCFKHKKPICKYDKACESFEEAED